MVELKKISYQEDNLMRKIGDLIAWDEESHAGVESAVDNIIAQVRSQGDSAVLALTHKFDSIDASSIKQLKVDSVALNRALNQIDYTQRVALEKAAERIRTFHEKQLQPSWEFEDEYGNQLGQKVIPLDRVGIYVPGGKASYPSSVLMNALPAKVAGVEQIVMVVPTPNGEKNNMVLAAAAIAGVDTIFTIGGAQAVAALAYGTESIPRVDKIVGPGNIYVATAKKKVFGQVGIDMIAGPSEILVVSDGQSDPEWIAMDLFSQAEHDEIAQAILVSPDQEFLQQVSDAMARLLPTQPRKDIISASLSNRGAMVHVKDMDQAIEVINRIAPEHLELSVENPETLVPSIRHAGAIFMGRYTAEALGDYCAGPNHVLPTSGTARFASPLGVYDFQKRSSLINCSAYGASELGKIASELARGEDLTAHAESAEYRIK